MKEDKLLSIAMSIMLKKRYKNLNKIKSKMKKIN